jgi:hypothetical protein
MSCVAVTMQNQRKQKAAAEEIEKIGGAVTVEPTWLGNLLRDESLVRVVDVSWKSITDAGLVHLQRLSQLLWLVLNNTKVTDQGVKKLQQALPKCQIEH